MRVLSIMHSSTTVANALPDPVPVVLPTGTQHRSTARSTQQRHAHLLHCGRQPGSQTDFSNLGRAAVGDDVPFAADCAPYVCHLFQGRGESGLDMVHPAVPMPIMSFDTCVLLQMIAMHEQHPWASGSSGLLPLYLDVSCITPPWLVEPST